MGLITTLKSFFRSGNFSETTGDPGGGAIITSEHFSAPGDDSYPLPGDIVAVIEIPRGGGAVAVGYIDPSSTPKTAAGEKRIYSRGTGGVLAVEVWLKADGTALISNGTGYVRLDPSGEVNINGARITPTGDVITALGISLDGHKHTQGVDSAGNIQQDVSVPY